MKNRLKTSLVILFTVFLGISIHFADPLLSLFILGLWGVLFFFSLATLTIGIFSKKFRFWYLIGFIPFIVGYSFETGIRSYKHNKAVEITSQLEFYKKEKGIYPKDLILIKDEIEIPGLKYYTNPQQTNFRLEYLMDQYNREYFDSESNKWGTLGWND